MPFTEYMRTAILFVEASDRDAANADAALTDPDTGGAYTFSVPLSSTGEEPATFWAASTVIRPAILAQAEAIHQSKYPTGSIYRGQNEYDNEPDIVRYTWEEALADMGLQVIEEDIL